MLQEDFNSFVDELEANTQGLRPKDYEKGYRQYGWDNMSRDVNDKIPEFQPKARYLKQLWNKHVDRQFVQSLNTVHWLHPTKSFADRNFKTVFGHKRRDNSYRLIWNYLEDFFATTPKSGELSVNGFLPGMPMKSSWGLVGIQVRGHITFAGNHMDTVWSGDQPNTGWKDFQRVKHQPARRRPGIFTSIENIKGNLSYVLDRNSFDDNMAERGANELFVANWEPVAIVLPAELWEVLGPKWRRMTLRLARDKKIKVVDNNGNQLKLK